ncbi:MAG: hypothetical protein CfClM3_0607 [Methanobrevibacter sp. CfCl-M3]
MVCRIKTFKQFFIDGTNGSDSNSGESENDAFLTMDYAVDFIRNKSLGYGGAIELCFMASGVYETPDLSEIHNVYFTGKVNGVKLQLTDYTANSIIYRLECMFINLTIDWSAGTFSNYFNVSIETSDIHFNSCNIIGSFDLSMSSVVLGGYMTSVNSSDMSVTAKPGSYSCVNIGSGSKVTIGEDNCIFIGTSDQLAFTYLTNTTPQIETNGMLVAIDKADPSSTADISQESNQHYTNIGYYSTTTPGSNQTPVFLPPGLKATQTTSSPADNTVPVLVARTPTTEDPNVWEVVYKPFLESHKSIRSFIGYYVPRGDGWASCEILWEMVKLTDGFYIRPREITSVLSHGEKRNFFSSELNTFDGASDFTINTNIWNSYILPSIKTVYTEANPLQVFYNKQLGFANGAFTGIGSNIGAKYFFSNSANKDIIQTAAYSLVWDCSMSVNTPKDLAWIKINNNYQFWV